MVVLSERLEACQKPTHIANTMNNPLIVQVCSNSVLLLVILCSICGNFSESGADFFSLNGNINIKELSAPCHHIRKQSFF